MQEKQDRAWPDINLRPLFELPTDPDIPLYNPAGARTDKSGNIYVVDLGDLKVYRFDSSGQYSASYGAGVGEGPGEFTSIMDWGTAGDSMVYVVDHLASRISFFGISGTFMKVESLQFTPLRYVLTPKGRSYTMINHTDHVLESRKAEDVAVFGSTDGPRPNSPGPGLNSGVLTTYEERLLFASTYWPVIVQYNTDGSVHYARATPDWGRVEDPYWKEVEISGMRGFRTIYELNSGDLSVYEGKLFVHVYLDYLDPEAEEVIDVYEAPTGDNEYSFRLPQRSTHTHVMHDRVYQVTDTTVVVYAIES